MNIFQSLLNKAHNAGGGSVGDAEVFDNEAFDVFDSENVGECLRHPPPTPSRAMMTLPQHRSRHHQQHTARAVCNMIDDPIPRPAIETNNHWGKMLALPIPTVRLVDVNIRREPCYMGINPITLMGETALLPGSWGDGKELMSTMAWSEPRGQLREQESATSRTAAETQKLVQQDPGCVVIDMNELRMQYAQAILDGDIFEESGREDTPLQMAMPSQREVADANNNNNENDWVDVSDDEEGAICGEGSSHRREDSGYSSGETERISNTTRADSPVAHRRKTVRFDEEAIEKPQGELGALKFAKGMVH